MSNTADIYTMYNVYVSKLFLTCRLIKNTACKKNIQNDKVKSIVYSFEHLKKNNKKKEKKKNISENYTKDNYTEAMRFKLNHMYWILNRNTRIM